jgi:hypothetical protein
MPKSSMIEDDYRAVRSAAKGAGSGCLCLVWLVTGILPLIFAVVVAILVLTAAYGLIGTVGAALVGLVRRKR